MRILKVALTLACFGAAACSAGPELESESEQTLGTTAKFLRSKEPLQGQYIVVLADTKWSDTGVGIAAQANELATRHGGEVVFTYSHALRGFTVRRMTEAQALALSRNPEVKYVQEDGIARIDATQSPATWGLDRIDQRNLPLSNSYTYNGTGQGVNAYIIDTGIRATHSEFAGRMAAGYTSIADGNGTNDCNGHGTHVAGTVGGTTYGVAKGVRLYPVRVLSCSGSGSWSGVIAGIDWVTANHVKPAVANMSLGGGANQAVDDAVTRSINAGVTYAVAAGNSNADACGFSPARTPAALTVGATTNTDARASYSNFGPCLDLFAPGSSITSAWHTSDTAINTISGTSMASPHVAGVAALFLQTNTLATPAQVNSAIINNATTGVVTNPGTGSPNRLLFSGFITAPGPDLVVTNITRDAYYYRVTFCNVGSSAGSQTFTVNLRNASTGQSFESNYLYPFSIPAPGTCAATGGFTCGLIGDSGCNLPIPVEATVDFRNTVPESNETNNKRTVQF